MPRSISGTAETTGGAVVENTVVGSNFPILKSTNDLFVLTVRLLLPVPPMGQVYPVIVASAPPASRLI